MSRARSRKGFATATAVALIGLVALASGAILTLFNTELRRTRQTAEEAQLRQLLVAGERAAAELLSARPEPGEGEQTVALPSFLAGEGVKLSLHFEPPGGAGPVNVRVEATLGRTGLAQVLRYERSADAFKLAGATLEQPTRLPARAGGD